MRNDFFAGKDFSGTPFKALMPRYYPKEYQEYIKQETRLLKNEVSGKTSVLEAGVGNGRIIPAVAPKVKRLIGIDSSDVLLREAILKSKRYQNVQIINGYLENLGKIFPKSHFDLSLCIWNTLGNVKDETKVLKELRKVTSGEIIITVYLKGTLKNRLNWYKTLGIKIDKVDREKEIFYTKSGLRSKSYSIQDMVELADQSGLKITEIKVLNNVMMWVKMKNRHPLKPQ